MKKMKFRRGFVIYILDNSVHSFLCTDAEKYEVALSRTGRLCISGKGAERFFVSHDEARKFLESSKWSKYDHKILLVEQYWPYLKKGVSFFYKA